MSTVSPPPSLPDTASSSSRIRERLALLSSQAPILKGVFAGIRETTRAAKDSADQAENVTRMVRQLDREEKTILKAMGQVEEAQELREAIIGLKEATDAKEHAATAAFIHQISQYPDAVLQGPLTPFILPTGEQEGKIIDRLNGAKTGLSITANREFDRAVASADLPKIQYYFKIFPLINEALHGLQVYGEFLCDLIAQRSRSRPMQEEKSQMYAEELRDLLETLALAVDHHTPLVETHYGPGAMAAIIRRLQIEGERQGRRIIESFEESRQPMKLMEGVEKTQRTIGNRPVRTREAARDRAVSISASDVKGVDAYLTELSSMMRAYYLYKKFMRARVQNELAALELAANDSVVAPSTLLIQTLQLPEAFDKDGCVVSSTGSGDGTMRSLLEGMMKSYLPLDRYYLKRSLEKAFEMDTLEEGCITTTCVDDAFFLLKKITFRVLSTGDVEVGLAALTMISRVAMMDVLRPMQNRALGEQEGYWTIAENVKTPLIGMNNIILIDDYVTRLRTTLEEELKEGGGRRSQLLDPADAGNLVKSLSLLEDVAKKARSILEIVRRRYFDQAFRPRMKAAIQRALRPVSYHMSDDDWEKYELGDGFVEVVVEEYNHLISVINNKCGEQNSVGIYAMATSLLQTEWEAWLMQQQGKVNLLGALRMDKDLRMLIAHISNSKAASSVHCLEKLEQRVALLNAEELDEVPEMWQSLAGSANALSAVEAKRVLALRYEWEPSQILALDLSKVSS